MCGVVKQQKLVQIAQSTSVAEDSDEPSTSTQQAELDVDLQLDEVETTTHDTHASASSSEKKISGNLDAYFSPEFVDDRHAFVLVDSKLLCSFLSSNVNCESCADHLQTSICFENRRGYCFDVMGHCKSCATNKVLFSTSGTCEKKKVFQFNFRKTPYVVNARMLAFAKKLGLGLGALQTFSKCLNSPPSMTQNSYESLFNKYLEVLKTVAEESIKQAAYEIMKNKIVIMIHGIGRWFLATARAQQSQ